MRTTLLPFSFLLTTLVCATPQVPDSTGLPGDNFSLRGALELFKNAKDLDAFEQALNTEANHVNNLDLDANGEIDYIHVKTIADGDARVIVLQVALAKEDLQDVAAIELEKTGAAVAAIQIRGDEELYPESTIIEPQEEVKEGGRKAGGPSAPAAQVTLWVNVWMWPGVQWCYGPSWYGWSSPWYWGYYPQWWSPWRPFGWGYFWGFPRPYYGWYHPVHICRVEQAHNIYAHRRSVSSTVVRNNTVVRQRSNAGEVKPTAPVRDAKPGSVNDPARKPARPADKPATRPTNKPPARTSPHKAPSPAKQPGRTTPRKAPGNHGGKR
ncbi:MAG: hypothetical protein IPP83_19765 [Flavobacteriales bacterium]|nr:hypothetical protein [Flavobacteriales bacterium]